MAALEGKRALVTGAGTGIGREVALELARQGARVFVHHWGSLDGGENEGDDIRTLAEANGSFEADLRLVEACLTLVDAAAERLGGLDILVNNAGLTETKSFVDLTAADFDNLYHMNISGQFFCAQRAVQYMRGGAGGSIINMASLHGISSLPGYSVYAGTKGAILAWTRALAVELAPEGIRVNAVAPGWIDVPSDHVKFKNVDLEAGGRQIPRRRVGEPLDVARACAYLASEAADYVTGATLVVDGGLGALLALQTPEADYDAWR
jgi:NAD(P)-dependent dehydrogenase (short-subunit alcohol dehydrogenase family)